MEAIVNYQPLRFSMPLCGDAKLIERARRRPRVGRRGLTEDRTRGIVTGEPGLAHSRTAN